MKKEYKIRFNTQSDGQSLCWRILDNNQNEIVVNSVQVKVNSWTTKDYIKNLDCYKWHITCEGILNIDDDLVAIIS